MIAELFFTILGTLCVFPTLNVVNSLCVTVWKLISWILCLHLVFIHLWNVWTCTASVLFVCIHMLVISHCTRTPYFVPPQKIAVAFLFGMHDMSSLCLLLFESNKNPSFLCSSSCLCILILYFIIVPVNHFCDTSSWELVSTLWSISLICYDTHYPVSITTLYVTFVYLLHYEFQLILCFNLFFTYPPTPPHTSTLRILLKTPYQLPSTPCLSNSPFSIVVLGVLHHKIQWGMISLSIRCMVSGSQFPFFLEFHHQSLLLPLLLPSPKVGFQADLSYFLTATFQN